jgi:hypothetical protein
MGGEEVRSEDLFWVELKFPKKKRKASNICCFTLFFFIILLECEIGSSLLTSSPPHEFRCFK